MKEYQWSTRNLQIMILCHTNQQLREETQRWRKQASSSIQSHTQADGQRHSEWKSTKLSIPTLLSSPFLLYFSSLFLSPLIHLTHTLHNFPFLPFTNNPSSPSHTHTHTHLTGIHMCPFSVDVYFRPHMVGCVVNIPPFKAKRTHNAGECLRKREGRGLRREKWKEKEEKGEKGCERERSVWERIHSPLPILRTFQCGFGKALWRFHIVEILWRHGSCGTDAAL